MWNYTQKSDKRICRLTYVGQGLKFASNVSMEFDDVSPHIRGARIEIATSSTKGDWSKSPHIRGARIEIPYPCLRIPPIDVASHTWGED